MRQGYWISPNGRSKVIHRDRLCSHRAYGTLWGGTASVRMVQIPKKWAMALLNVGCLSDRKIVKPCMMCYYPKKRRQHR